MNGKSLLSLEKVLDAVKGKEISGKNADFFCFNNVQTDSRNISSGSLFVPLIGENQDGHKYVGQAVEKGASVVFIASSEYEKNGSVYDELCQKFEKLFIITVENTLKALQDAAAKYVEQFPNLIKVSVTGSSGKTTTKEMIVSVLQEKFNVVYTKGNFNSETGLPLSVFNIRENHEVGVFEMGMNRVHEMEEISAVFKPNFAVITNIGTAHIGLLGSRESIAHEKRHIFDYIDENGAAIIPESDDFKEFLGENVKGEKIYYGSYVPSTVSGVRFIRDLGVSGTVFSVDGLEINLKLPGLYNYSNALSAVALAKKLGLSAGEIKKGLENLSCVSGRMETFSLIVKNGSKITLIKDCYNANPDSMKSALGFMKTVENAHQKIYVLGDMLELGNESNDAHTEIGKLVAIDKPDYTVFVGEEMKAAYEQALKLGYENGKYIKEHDEEAMQKIAGFLNEKLSESDVLLLKASRGISLERIIPLIQKTENSKSGGEK